MKKKLVIVFIVFTAIGVGLFFLLTRGTIGVTYDTAKVTKGEVGQYVQALGTISSKDIRRYYGSGVNKVEEMPLKLGDRVEKGQLLLKYEDITASNLENLALNLDIVDLEIQRVGKQIEALEALYNDAEAGADMESVNSARIEISRLQNQIDSATKDRDRTETLYNEGITTLVEYEQSVEKINQLNSSLGLANNTYNKLVKGISDATRKKYEADIDALLLSSEILGKNKEILEKNKQTLLEDAEKNQFIVADVEGIVTALNTYVGDTPYPGTMMIEIQDPTQKVILVDFMVEDALKISDGLAADVHDIDLDISLDDLEVNQVYPNAFVTLSELGVKENRQTVEVGMGASADHLPFGLELETNVMIAPERETLLVPAGAVYNYDGKHYIEVLVGGEPVEREITIGIKIMGNIEVLEGVSEGEDVVLNYQED